MFKLFSSPAHISLISQYQNTWPQPTACPLECVNLPLPTPLTAPLTSATLTLWMLQNMPNCLLGLSPLPSDMTSRILGEAFCGHLTLQCPLHPPSSHLPACL